MPLKEWNELCAESTCGKYVNYIYFKCPAGPPLPWYKFISLPSLPLPLKSKMAAIISVMKSLSTRSPKLHLLYRLGRGWYFFRL